ncbi:hypothetical protein [Anabaena sphaerica]|uniref:hypothetical protein n=1 Tax=Anabaena sphaerica TaxID=212446 RepID=UPI001F5493C9|nr:hypothetical protein [Anabaena sphaerica]
MNEEVSAKLELMRQTLSENREIVATPTATETLAAGMAVAWNPSLAGAKVEDTFVILEDGKLENLTFDPNFPSVEVEGRLRAMPLVK